MIVAFCCCQSLGGLAISMFAACLVYHLCNEFPALNSPFEIPKLVYVLDWTLTDTVINVVLDRLSLRQVWGSLVKIFSRSLDIVTEDLATGTGLEVSNM